MQVSAETLEVFLTFQDKSNATPLKAKLFWMTKIESAETNLSENK